MARYLVRYNPVAFGGLFLNEFSIYVNRLGKADCPS